jgi:hypothetical protein
MVHSQLIYQVSISQIAPDYFFRKLAEGVLSRSSPEKSPKSGQITLIHRTSPEKRLLSGQTIQRPGISLKFLVTISKHNTSDRYADYRHKSVPSSLQASLDGTDLNRWLSYLPSMVPAYQLACGLRICRTR